MKHGESANNNSQPKLLLYDYITVNDYASLSRNF